MPNNYNLKLTRYGVLSPINNLIDYPLSFYIVLLFWASIYLTGIRDVIHGYIGWVIILFVWFMTFSINNNEIKRSAITIILKNNKEIIMLAIWTSVLLVNILFDRGDSNTAYQHLTQTIVLWLIYLLATLYLHNSPERYRLTCNSVIIVLGISSVIVLPPLYANPGLLREIKYNSAQLSGMGLNWVGTTNFFSGYSIALPCLYVFILQQESKYKLIYVFLCLMSMLAILMSTMASAVFLMFIGIIGLLIIVPRTKNFVNIKMVLFGMLFILFLVFIMYSNKIEQLDFIFEKYNYIIANFSTGNISEVERGADTLLSLNVIKEFPLFGVGPVTVGTFNVIGEHSSWIDNIAQYGLLGFAPFLGFLYLGLYRLWRSCKLDSYNLVKRARIISYLLYLLQGLVNPWAFDSTALTLFLILAMAPEQS